jgi:hypothetical protein
LLEARKVGLAEAARISLAAPTSRDRSASTALDRAMATSLNVAETYRALAVMKAAGRSTGRTGRFRSLFTASRILPDMIVFGVGI